MWVKVLKNKAFLWYFRDMYIKIRVLAGQKHEKIEKISNDIFHVLVKEPAERNLANKRIKALLADFYSIPESSVRIVSGHHKPSKIFDIVLPAVDSSV